MLKQIKQCFCSTKLYERQITSDQYIIACKTTIANHEIDADRIFQIYFNNKSDLIIPSNQIAHIKQKSGLNN